MGWFDDESFKNLSTDDLQAQLAGLVHKVIARQHPLSRDMDKYEKLITELTRRKVKPNMTIIPKY